MRKLLTAAVVVAVGAVLASAAFAWQGYGPGRGAQVDVNALRQFQKETLPLRDEVAAKSLELRNEYTKESPDQARITKLQGDIGDLRAKIRNVAEKQGLPAWGRGPGMGGCWGRGTRMMGRDGCGYGPEMMGSGYGRGCLAW